MLTTKTKRSRNPQSYNPLPTSKEAFQESEQELLTPIDHAAAQSTHRPSRWYRILLCSCITFFLTLSIIQLYFLNQIRYSHTYVPDPSWLDTPEPCGSTPAEAEARGCLFAVGLVSWVPPACYDADLEETFRRDEPPEFYYTNADDTGPDLTRRIPSVELISTNPNRSWTTRRYHYAHCMESWAYMQKAFEHGRRLSKAIATLGHTLHCGMQFMNTSIPFEEVITQVTHIDYPECIRLSA